jgi:DtxR family Mn-dependent transcriptional regulator
VYNQLDYKVCLINSHGWTDRGDVLRQERVEEYLGAIYRLRADTGTPLPLSQLTEYFGFSPVSIHEMILKLGDEGWVVYHPYRGVTLSDSGEDAAEALLRRHRLWERFLSDILDLPWDEAHVVAGRLEHAASERVTERLASFLGEPDACPHGGPNPPSVASATGRCLGSVGTGAEVRIVGISPETPERLRRAAALGLRPGCRLRVLVQDDVATEAALLADDDRIIRIPAGDAQAIWLELL